jgi:hypothetical protein
MVNLMVLEIFPLQMLSLAMLVLVLPIQYSASSRGAFFWPLSFALPNSSSVPRVAFADERVGLRELVLGEHPGTLHLTLARLQPTSISRHSHV